MSGDEGIWREATTTSGKLPLTVQYNATDLAPTAFRTLTLLKCKATEIMVHVSPLPPPPSLPQPASK